MVKFNDLLLKENSIINLDDDYELPGLKPSDSFYETKNEILDKELNEEDLKKIYYNDIRCEKANLRIIFGEGRFGLSTNGAPKIPGARIYNIGEESVFIPGDNCIIVMSSADGDDDPDTNDFYFIWLED